MKWLLLKGAIRHSYQGKAKTGSWGIDPGLFRPGPSTLKLQENIRFSCAFSAGNECCLDSFKPRGANGDSS